MSILEIVGSSSNQKIYAKLCDIENNFKNGIHEAYIVISRYLIRTNKKDFRSPKSGRFYRYNLNGRIITHRASAPGEPPARLTGRLENTISTRTPGSTSMTYSAGNDEVIYARFLEEGTVKMEPRPFMIKSIRDNQGLIIESFYDYIGRFLR